MGAPNGSSHARPWLFDRQNALDIITMNLLTRDWVDNGRLDAKEWQ